MFIKVLLITLRFCGEICTLEEYIQRFNSVMVLNRYRVLIKYLSLSLILCIIMFTNRVKHFNYKFFFFVNVEYKFSFLNLQSGIKKLKFLTL